MTKIVFLPPLEIHEYIYLIYLDSRFYNLLTLNVPASYYLLTKWYTQNQFLMLSIQEIWDRPRIFFLLFSPELGISCSRLYYSGCRKTCPGYWSFAFFILFTTSRSLFIRSKTLIFVMWSHELIANILRSIQISNPWIWLVETLDKAQSKSLYSVILLNLINYFCRISLILNLNANNLNAIKN